MLQNRLVCIELIIFLLFKNIFYFGCKTSIGFVIISLFIGIKNVLLVCPVTVGNETSSVVGNLVNSLGLMYEERGKS